MRLTENRMTKNKKRKRAIRRLAEQNERGYQGQWRVSEKRSSGPTEEPDSRESGRLVSIIERLIALGEARLDEYQRDRPEIGITIPADDATIEYLQKPRPAEQALKKALIDLDHASLLKVEAVMYAGRDGEDVMLTYHHLPRDNHTVTAHMVGSKLPLPEYLRDGLRLVKQQGVDLDTEWPVPNNRTKTVTSNVGSIHKLKTAADIQRRSMPQIGPIPDELVVLPDGRCETRYKTQKAQMWATVPAALEYHKVKYTDFDPPVPLPSE